MSDTDESLLENLSDMLLEIFRKDEKIIKNLVTELDSAPYFHIDKIAQILESNPTKSLSYINTLSTMTHFYTSHKPFFDEELKISVLDPIREKINLFLSSLSKNGIDGLQINYFGELQRRSNDHMLSSFTDEFILKLIYDEQGNVIGEFPLVKLTIGKIDERDDLSYESFHVSINSLKTLGDQFLKSYKDNIIHAKKYKDKIGNSVIIYDEK